MITNLALLCIAIAVSSCASLPATLPHHTDEKWFDFKIRYMKEYSNDFEEAGRHFIWKKKMEEIDAHNADPKNTYQMGENHFSDMSHAEFLEKHSGCFKIPEDMIVNGTLKRHPASSQWMPPSNADPPASIDWRELGAVTPVKNQGQCGSCWAFSSTGALEGQWFRKNKTLPSLSEQQLVDCCKTNAGCRGGWQDNAFTYIATNGGIDNEQGYPYYARELGYCYYRPQYNTAQDKNFQDIYPDETSLKIAVGTQGPIAVAIDATRPGFVNYRSGVYYDSTCKNTLAGLEHAVLVVGYGSENGQDYWLVKNSWATTWGDNGYIKMARNWGNMCGIALKATYPLV